MKKNIFITLEGGIIQNIAVSADLHNIKIIIIDLDPDNALKSELALLPSSKSAKVFKYPVAEIGDGDIGYFKEILKNI